MARQRVRVQGVDAGLVGVIALGSGVGAALAEPSPTGHAAYDALLVLTVTAAAVWAAASAPWWAGVAVAAIATALAPEPLLVLVGAAAMAGGLAIGAAQRAVPWSRALVAGLAVQVLARLGEVQSFGVSSLIAIGAMTALIVFGVRRRPRRERRWMWWALVIVAGVAVVAAVGLGVAALGAKDDLSAANSRAREGIDHLSGGDFDSARVSFIAAAEAFERADAALGKPWAQPARLVPVLAQHQSSAAGLVADAGDVSALIASTLEVIDYDNLRVVNGRIDVSSIELLEQPLGDLIDAIDDLGSTVADVRSPWLVPAISTRLDDLEADIADQQERGDNALLAVQQAPEMLGTDGARVYFIAFTTPAEARGLGGFMGNWAEMTITDGKIEVTDFGRTLDLNEGGAATKTLTVPTDLLFNYGDFLLADLESGVVGPQAWSNITASPDFPAVAQVIAELYPQSGGRQLDGVFAMDVETVARLMQLSGPVELAELGIEVDSSNAVDFLMRDQYTLTVGADEERVDALETVAMTTIERLLSSELPAPPELADLLGPMTSQGRLLGWAARPEDEEVFRRLEMSGDLPAGTSDAVMVTFSNGVGNKIDDLMDASATYDVRPDESTGQVAATLTITLTNNAPAAGLPDSIIGNVVELPTGTNRMFLQVYAALPFDSVTVNGEPDAFSIGEDAGYLLMSGFVEIGPGATTVVQFELAGGQDLTDGYSLSVRTPPTARPFPVVVTVDGVLQPGGDTGEAGVRRYDP